MRTICFMLAVTAGYSTLRAANADDAIRNAEKAWAHAVVERDYSALDKILADQLIYAHATGAVESKEQYIGRLRSGAQKYDTIEHETIRVVVYGDSAVSHSTVRMTGISNGKPFNDHVMMLHAWVRQGGTWRVAAHQTTKITP